MPGRGDPVNLDGHGTDRADRRLRRAQHDEFVAGNRKAKDNPVSGPTSRSWSPTSGFGTKPGLGVMS